jgi:GNAT superfamily N-acetyltransferase
MFVTVGERSAGMEILRITKEGLPEAMDLVWKVFLEFEAPEYSQEGIDEFKRFIDGQAEEMTIEMYGAFENGELLGVIATRNEGSHIALLFVRTECHGRSIGRTLFEHIIPLSSGGPITVNSSPYAAKIYRKLGFTDTAAEQITNGIRYVPMSYLVGEAR